MFASKGWNTARKLHFTKILSAMKCLVLCAEISEQANFFSVGGYTQKPAGVRPEYMNKLAYT